MKSTYRCTIFFTDPQFANTRPSNIFINAEDESLVKPYAESLFKEILKTAGIPDASFKTEIRLSSPEEVEEYETLKRAGVSTNAVVN